MRLLPLFSYSDDALRLVPWRKSERCHPWSNIDLNNYERRWKDLRWWTQTNFMALARKNDNDPVKINLCHAFKSALTRKGKISINLKCEHYEKIKICFSWNKNCQFLDSNSWPLRCDTTLLAQQLIQWKQQPQVFCSTCLPLGGTGRVWSTIQLFSLHCPLFKQCVVDESRDDVNNSRLKFLGNDENRTQRC